MPSALGYDRGIVISPTFWEYETSLKRADKSIEIITSSPKEGFHIYPEQIKEIILKGDIKNTALYLCNPNNPTSRLIKPEVISDICEQFEELKVIIDETYMMFRQDYEQLSMMRYTRRYRNLIVITSFSKFYSVPGLRIGIIVSNEENTKAVKNRLTPHGVNIVALTTVPYLLKARDYADKSRQLISQERTRFFRKLGLVDYLTAFEPDGNFILLRINNLNYTSTEISEHLKARGILIRDGNTLPGLNNRYLRLSIRTPQDNELLIETLKQYKK